MFEPSVPVTNENHTKARVQPGFFVPKQWWNALIDLVFPPRCANCGRVDAQWCHRCAELLKQTPLKFVERHDFDNLAGCASSGVHEGVLRNAIHALKYENTRQVASLLGARLAECLQTTIWKIDTLIPVPLHHKRLLERGYNQSQEIAEALALQTGLAISTDGLRRERSTESQVELNREQRFQNVADAFVAEAALVHQKTVLLIDDVCTTGATLDSCAKALLTAGAVAVYALTVTRASD